MSEGQGRKTGEFVSLLAGGQSFCVEITQIREIRRWSAATPLPFSEPAVLGVMNLRGSVIPIVDLVQKLGWPPSDPTDRHVIIVVVIGDRSLGLVVETVSEIFALPLEDISDAPDLGAEGQENPVVGLISIDDQMCRVLDLQVLFGGHGATLETDALMEWS